MSDAFDVAKERVSCLEAADRYALPHDRHGFARCIFHSGDDTPSLKLYPDSGGFYCFSCHKSGSVVDLTQALLSLSSALDAVKVLNVDFGLGLNLDRHRLTAAEIEAARQARAERELRKSVGEKLEAWRWRTLNELADLLRTAFLIPEGREPTHGEAALIRWYDYLDYLYNLLIDNDYETTKELFYARREIEQRCQALRKALQESQSTKSSE